MAELTGNSKFTYDFGIAIARGTVQKITKLAGASLTLAGAFNALRESATEYVKTLKSNAVIYGGVLSTMKQMEQAQNRLVQGQSKFGVQDQLDGMRQLRAVGVDLSEQMKWIDKAAHATGKTFTEFSSMITQAINGNLSGLVEAGLMTQRATKMFEKYQGNTIMMQSAIMKFLRQHKGLQKAIVEDFDTIQDQITRIRGTWKGFFKSIVGAPNDPNSLYGQVNMSLKRIAEAFSRHYKDMQTYAQGIGQVIGWVVHQIGSLTLSLGRALSRVTKRVLGDAETFSERMRSLVVWLEFWKVHAVKILREYGDELRTILKLIIMLKLAGNLFSISGALFHGLSRIGKSFKGLLTLQQKYIKAMGDVGTATSRWFQSLAVFMPKWMRKVHVFFGKHIGGIIDDIVKLGFKRGSKFAIKSLMKIIPVWGWIASAAISMFTILYKHSELYRKYIKGIFNFASKSLKGIFGFVVGELKIIWNLVSSAYYYVRIGIHRVIGWFKNLFKKISTGVHNIWDKITNNKASRWLKKHIIDPLNQLHDRTSKNLSSIKDFFNRLVNWSGRTKAKAKEAYDAEFNTPTQETPTATASGQQAMASLEPVLVPTGSTLNTNQSTTTSNISSGTQFNYGAVQIHIDGSNSDPQQIAEEVRRILSDMDNSAKKRSGVA